MTAVDDSRAVGAWPGVFAVAATYVYFLLFAQFGFLGMLEEQLGDLANTRPVMAVMGVGGLLASFATAGLLRRVRAERLIRIGFASCGVTALVAPVCRGRFGFTTVAASIGVATGLLTVALASDLRRIVGGRNFGLKLGVGTGTAYLFCNVPGVFDARPPRQALIVAVVAALGLIVTRSREDDPSVARNDPPRALTREDTFGLGFLSIVLSFLALVWIDSAAFVVIQETNGLKAATWGGPGRTFLIGTCHLLAAVVAGRSIDLGLFRSLLLATFGLFLVGFSILGAGGGASGLAGPLYALGISTYSVALIAYPSLRSDRVGVVPARWRAAIVFGVCGWVGSALGVGMAQDLRTIPPAFLVAAGGVLLAGAALGRRGPASPVARPRAIAIVLGLTAAIWYMAPPLASGRVDPSAVQVGDPARGQEVYLAEGCVHCHSQYVRPNARDELWWGPRGNASERYEHRLIGRRRQGPDLSNVGNRRSADWQRLHLIDPRAVSPGSRMPSYAHLFAPGTTRGDDLVAYLTNLGSDGLGARYEMTRKASLGAAGEPGRADRGRTVFTRWCATCHGVDGRGDAPNAADIRRPSMNLRKPNFWLISWGGPNDEPEQVALARVVKFGVGGTSMPGHEYLTDAEIADVTAYVRSIRGTDAPVGAD